MEPIADAGCGSLALLAKGPSYGYELRQRMVSGVGSAGCVVLNAGQVYVTLGRLELGVAWSPPPMEVGSGWSRPDRRVYAADHRGPAGIWVNASWLVEVDWPKPAPAEFHLKLTAVAASARGWRIRWRWLIPSDSELLRKLRDVRGARRCWPGAGRVRAAALLLEGIVLQL